MKMDNIIFMEGAVIFLEPCISFKYYQLPQFYILSVYFFTQVVNNINKLCKDEITYSSQRFY